MYNNRDISNESILNICFRIFQYSLRRLRGAMFRITFSFKGRVYWRLYVGHSCTFKNTRAITLGNCVNIGNNCRLEVFKSESNKGALYIGHSSSLGNNVHVGSINSIFIGEHVLMGSNILIIDHNHGDGKNLIKYEFVPPKKRKLITKGPIIIEDNVWIGDNVVVLGDVVIGKGAVIAAGALVKNDVLPYTLHK